MNKSLATLRDIVEEANLSVQKRQSILNCMDKLPSLYRDFEQTYNIRYRDAIARLVGQMLFTLGNDSVDSPDASNLAEGIVKHLGAMHQRLGIPSLGLKCAVGAKSPAPNSVINALEESPASQKNG